MRIDPQVTQIEGVRALEALAHQAFVDPDLAEDCATHLDFSSFFQPPGPEDTEEYHAKNLRRLYPRLSEEASSVLAAARVASLSPNPFIRAVLWHRFPVLTSFFLNQGDRDPWERASAEVVLATAANNLILGGVGSFANVLEWAEKVYAASVRVPPPLPTELTTEFLLEETRQEPITITPDQLPKDWKEKAGSLSLDLPHLPKVSLWDFIASNMALITFVLRGPKPYFWGPLAHAFANIIFHTTTLRLERTDSVLQILAWLGHEACHHHMFQTVLPQNPRAAVDPGPQEALASAVEKSILNSG